MIPTGFSPYPGFDPLDGIEPGVAFSADNPCARADDSNHRRNKHPDTSSFGGKVILHGEDLHDAAR